MILLWIFSHNWHFLHWIPLDLTENLKHERYELAPDDPTLIFKWFFPLGLNFSQSQHKNVQKKSNFPMEIAYVDFSSPIFIDSKKRNAFSRQNSCWARWFRILREIKAGLFEASPNKSPKEFFNIDGKCQ